MRLVGRPSEAEIVIVVGDGSSDWPRIERALERHNDDHCDVSVYLPPRSKEGKGRMRDPLKDPAKGIRGVFGYIKTAVTAPPRNFVVFIDREHLWELDRERLSVVEYISKRAQDYGIGVNVQRLTDNTYRVCGRVGDKGFLTYFIFVGSCCMEDLILGACRRLTEEVRGPGCCRKYKEALKKLPQEKRRACEDRALDYLFREFLNALDDYRRNPCTN